MYCYEHIYTEMNIYVSATESVSRNSESHMESVQAIKCMLFILIFNNYYYKHIFIIMNIYLLL